MKREFLKEVEATGYIHYPLPLHVEKSLEEKLKSKPVLSRKEIWHNGTEEGVSHTGRGRVEIVPGKGVNGGNAILLTAPLSADSFPEGARPDGNYANFGTMLAEIRIDRENWEDYNRLSCCIKPDYPGRENVFLIVGVHNDGEKKLPDRYYREGFHIMNLQNHVYNEVIWEFPTIPRDCITKVIFYMFLSGDDGLTEGYAAHYIDNVAVEKVKTPEHTIGWQPDYDTILYSTAGYDSCGKKTAITTVQANTFTLCDANGNAIYTAPVQRLENEKGKFGILDFSDIVTEGEYTIKVGEKQTPLFPIGKSVIEDAVWRTINFMFCQRCGYPVPGIHGVCHTDTGATHDGKIIIYNGGWHDAGDMSQFAVQTAEIMQAFFEMANHAPEENQLKNRLYEEGEWGLDFVLRNRFGDGYRGTTADQVRHPDGFIGNWEDIFAFIGNHPIDNFICASSLAYAGMSLQTRDKGRGDHAIRIAEEDYAFAMALYREKGFYTPLIPGEHTYSTSESLFAAMIIISSVNLYKATGKEEYLQNALAEVDKMLACQETGGENLPIKGFFYRDQNTKYPIHFNHQSREHLYVRALILLCECQKEHPDFTKWENALKLYAQYLKDMMEYVAPFGLVPSGVYSLAETEDRDLFKVMNFTCKYDEEHDHWVEQIKNGYKLSEQYYLRIHPVWFSHRGNAAVQLESGKAATLLGNYLNDDALRQIGREQMYWLLGKNPFGQSAMYGAGDNYCQQYALSTGEVTGELPVGFESYETYDIPYWPQGNNCTYKEVWTSPSRGILHIAADLIE